MRIAVRVDAAPRIGGGHLARCLVFATALRREGAAVTFVCRADDSALTAPLRTSGFPVCWLPLSSACTPAQDAAATRAALTGAYDWLIVDHYGLDAGWERALRARARRILALDDLADRPRDCDLLLNPNLPAHPARYRGLVPSACRLLLGPEYALLREEFFCARVQPRPRDGRVNRLLVSFGGSDPGNATARALTALELLARAGELHGIGIDVIAGPGHSEWQALRVQTQTLPHARFRRATRQMARFIAAADLAIGAGGGSLWERCFLGLPALVVTLADNQHAASAVLAARGACWHLGPAATLAPPALAQQVAALLHDPAAVRAAAAVALTVVGAAAFSRHPLRWLRDMQ